MRQARKVASDKPYIRVPHIPDLINNTFNSFNLLDFQFCPDLFITITRFKPPGKIIWQFFLSPTNIWLNKGNIPVFCDLLQPTFFNAKNKSAGQAWWHTLLISALRRQKEDPCESEGSLVYKVSSMTAML